MTGNDEKPYYGRARIIAGLTLFVLVGILSFLDYTSTEYALDSIQFALMLGTGSVLLGVEGGLEAARKLRGE